MSSLVVDDNDDEIVMVEGHPRFPPQKFEEGEILYFDDEVDGHTIRYPIGGEARDGPLGHGNMPRSWRLWSLTYIVNKAVLTPPTRDGRARIWKYDLNIYHQETVYHNTPAYKGLYEGGLGDILLRGLRRHWLNDVADENERYEYFKELIRKNGNYPKRVFDIGIPNAVKIQSFVRGWLERKKKNIDYDMCVICYENMYPNTQNLRIFCDNGHTFHNECIEKWVESERQRAQRWHDDRVLWGETTGIFEFVATCPICRAPERKGGRRKKRTRRKKKRKRRCTKKKRRRRCTKKKRRRRKR
jgi:hypothetical protein